MSDNYSTSPATAVLSSNVSWRTIPGGTTSDMVFEFANPPAASDYSVSLSFDVGCPKSSSQ